MLISTAEAATILGSSPRQVLSSVRAGRLDAVRLGGRVRVYEHQVFALERMKLPSRRWNQETWTAALDLLSGLETVALSGSQLSRLKSKLQTMPVEEVVGYVLAGRVRLFAANDVQKRAIGSTISKAAGLTGLGICVIAAEDLDASARRFGIASDPEGHVVAVQTSEDHRAVIEGLAYIAYGSTREERVGRDWLAAQSERVVDG